LEPAPFRAILLLENRGYQSPDSVFSGFLCGGFNLWLLSQAEPLQLHSLPHVPHPQGDLFPVNAERKRQNRYPPASSAITATTIASIINTP